MCVEGTRAEPLYCKYVTGTAAGTRKGASQGEMDVRVVVDAKPHCDLYYMFNLHFT